MSNQKPNREALDALRELCGLTEDAAIAALVDLIPHKNTRVALVRCASDVSPKTLKSAADFFNNLLPLKLTAADLVDPPPLLQAVVRGARARGAAPGAARAPAALAVHKSQNAALAALCDHPDLDRAALNGATVRVVAFTLDKLIEQVQAVFLTELEIGHVELYLGCASVARDLRSARQQELIHELTGKIDKELAKHNEGPPRGAGAPREPVRGDKINEYRYRCAPTFQGWLIPNVVVCVAQLGWFPAFLGRAGDDDVRRLKKRYEKKHIHTDNPPDEHALNGWMMPHTQAFYVPGADNTDFLALQEQFQLFTDAHWLAESAGQ